MKANIEQSSSRGYDFIRPEDYLYNQKRMIVLNGEVNAESAVETNLQLLTLNELDPTTPIILYLNGPGGSIYDGYSIIDTMHLIPVPVYTLAAGNVCSMDALLLAAGETGHRYALENARIMIHEPLLSSGVAGSATSILRTSESIMMTKQKICRDLAVWTGKSVEEVEKATSYDNYMTAEEAVAFGMCDKIIRSFDEVF